MKLHYDEETERFRAELRDWLATNQPTPEELKRDPWISSGHMPEWGRRWQQRLFKAGWLVPGWEPEYGGRNATPVQQLVYFEEMATVPVMRSCNVQGLTIIAPSIRDYGSPEQQERYVLPTLRAEITWCLGMSEPGAGSDLASLSTQAEQQDDHFVVTGQKVWTSGANEANLCFCFVRTDPYAPKHSGISVLIIDMQSPGITTRPMPSLISRERADFNDVFFDGVVVPHENLVGQLNQGWSITTGSLAHERGMLWTQQATRLERLMEELRELADRPGAHGTRLGDDPVFRDEYASLYVDTQALKFMGYRGFAKFVHGEPSPEHSVLKLLGSELEQRLGLMASESLGASALDAEFAGYGLGQGPPPWGLAYLQSFGNTIAGGTSEIQRNIIAQRVLGLPRR